MLNLKTTRGWFSRVWWALALLLCVGMAQAAPVGTLIPAPNRWDMVYDVARDVVYITNGSQILRYRIAANAFLTPYDCGAGASLSGIDLSPDGNTLIACDTSYDTNNAWVRVVDLTTDTVRRQDFPRFWNEAGTFAVAFGYDGSAIITSRFAGSGSVQMRRYYPATGALVRLPSVEQDTMPCASADGTVIALAESNISGGEWDRYRIADGNFAHVGNTSAFNYEIGVNRNATQYAVPTYFGTYIYNSSFATLFTIGSYAGPQPIAAAYHPNKDIVYFPWAGSSSIRAYRTTDFTLLGTYDFGHTFGSPGNRAFAQGRTKIARDGSYIFCTVAGGVRYASATVPTPPTSLVVDKPAPRVGEDVTATASGSWHPEGLAINYEYDWSKLASAGEYVAASASRSAQSKPTQILMTAIKRFTAKAWGDHTGAVLPGTETAKGDQWQVRGRVVDGSYSSDWLDGPTVTVGNTPPSTPTTLTTDPYNVHCYSTPRAIASGSTDADGDSPLTYQFQWAKWDTSVGAWGPWERTSTDGALGDVTLTKGDRWQVRARAFDGTNYSAFAGPYAVTVANAPPSVPTSLMVSPPEPVCTSTLTATADGSIDPDGVASIGYRYEWSKWSGSWWGQWLYSSTDGVLKGVTLRRGDRWRVQARGTEGAIGGLAFSPPVEVTIQDSPPSAPTSLVVTPENPKATDVVTAQGGGATDADTGDVVSHKYQWSKQQVGGTWSAWGYGCTDGKLAGASIQGGDVWRVQCCATDGTLDSAWTAPAQVTFAPPVQIVETGVGYATIQAAIAAATTGQTVEISPGTYHERINFLGKTITVRSTAPADPAVVAATVINGDAGGRVVTLATGEGSASILTGLTITNGRSGNLGGGIYCSATSPTISGNVISGSTAAVGAGIYSYGGSPTISGNTISGNSATLGANGSGGGIYVEQGQPVVSGNLILNNASSYFGGGISCESTTATLSGNMVQGNSSPYWGGGIWSNSGTITASGNIICGNTTGGSGGGIFCGGKWTFSNNTIVGNRADARGGGIYNAGASVTVDSSIIVSSTAGGGLYLSSGSFVTRYCNVYGNTGGNYVGTTDKTGTNGNTSTDPLFANPAAKDFHLKSKAGRWNGSDWVMDAANSPCIDAGDPASVYSNEPSPNGSHVDMGAYGNTAEASKSPQLVKIVETGVCWPTIQGAISAALNGQTVEVQQGTYHERINFLGKAITVRSTNPADPAVVAATVIDGDGGGSVVTFATNETIDAVLTGFTITNGRATNGGGIYSTSSPTISSNVITGNTAEANGGGVYGTGFATLSGNSIIGNHAVNGGGMYGSGRRVTGDTISGNVASGNGGGFCGTTTFYNCIFSSNLAATGGGIYCDAAIVTLGRCTVTGNSATVGGGICAYGPNAAYIYNSIVSFSTGSGIALPDGYMPSITYSDFYGNSGGNYVGMGISDQTGSGGNISADPQYVDVGAGDFHLKSTAGHYTPTGWVTDTTNSPCIDAGNPTQAYANEPVPNGLHVDMGAYANTAQASKSPELVKVLETGACWRTIQPAIDASVSGQTVQVRPGTYVECVNLGGKNITLRSVDPTDPAVVATTIIDGNGKGSVVTIANGEGASCVVTGLTLTGGRGQSDLGVRCGGGIFCKSSSPTISRNVIRNNIMASSGSGGAGIASVSGSPTISGNIIMGNSAQAAGGIYCKGGSPVIKGNIISGNSAMTAGGLYCDQTAATLAFNTISGNGTTVGMGGGVYCSSATVTISNSIIAFSSKGSGIYVVGTAPTVRYCDIYGNVPTDCQNRTSPVGSNGNISVDPLFANAAANDFRLKSTAGHFTGTGWVTDAITSACVDAGDPASPYDNEPTPNGGRANMGFEGNTAEASKQGSMLPSIPTALTVAPPAPTALSTLQATAAGALDPYSATATYKYEWSLVTESAGAHRELACKQPASKGLARKEAAWGYPSSDGRLIGPALRRGETWQVHACSTNSAGDSPWTDPVQVTIGNARPPAPASVAITPVSPTAGSELTATATSGGMDSDGDVLTYSYEWSLSTDGGSTWGEWGYSSSDGVLEGIALHAGEQWKARACADDGLAESSTLAGRQGIHIKAKSGAVSRAVSAWVESSPVTISSGPPSVPTSITVTPATPVCTSQLVAEASGAVDLDDDAVQYKYEWANQRAVGSWGDWGYASSDGKLVGVSLKRGDVWRVHACATDGTLDSAWTDPVQVTIGNTPPTAPVTVTITPSPTAAAGQALTATVTGITDADGDQLEYLFQWTKSGDGGLTWEDWSAPTSTAQASASLPAGTTALGERWKVRAAANDSIADGQWLESDAVSVAVPGVVLNQPEGSSAGPSWPVIRVGFAQAMNKSLTQAAFSLTVDGSSTPVTGSFVWVGDEMKYYVQGALAPLTTYRATVAATAETATGVAMSAPFTWTFTTNNVPALNSWSPKPAATLNTVVRVGFNQPMNAAATEGAFSVKIAGTSTAVPGSFSWSGNELLFTPSATLTADTTYRASLTSAAKSAADIALGASFSWDFKTNHGPTVVLNQPQRTNAGPSWPVIRVGFDQAMNGALTQAAFSLTPNGTTTPVPGIFGWSGNEMRYYVQGALAPLTTYRVTVAATAQSATGAAMASPFSWTFTTNNVPAINSWTPKTAVPLNSAIRLGFNQAMNQALTQGAFSLKVAGSSTPLPGSFSWSGNEMIFTPSAPLAVNTTYRASITTAAQSAGGVALGAPFSWDFKTNLGPTVCLNQPQGSSTGGSWPVIRVGFDQPMNATLTQAAFSIRQDGTSTAVPGYFGWANSELKYYVQGALAPLTTYRVTVAATAQSATGVALGTPFTWTFTTNNVPAIASWTPKGTVDANTVVKLTSNQPMNAALTEGAFSLKTVATSTAVAGAFSWSGNELTFTPSAPLVADTDYRASITTAAQSSANVALGAAFTWDFKTAPAGTGTAMVTAVASETRQGAQLLVTLGSKANVTATIRNMAGRPITVLQPGLLSAGAHTLLWNGKSANGVKVPAGTYLIEIAADAADGRTSRAVAAFRLRK